MPVAGRWARYEGREEVGAGAPGWGLMGAGVEGSAEPVASGAGARGTRGAPLPGRARAHSRCPGRPGGDRAPELRGAEVGGRRRPGLGTVHAARHVGLAALGVAIRAPPLAAAPSPERVSFPLR